MPFRMSCSVAIDLPPEVGRADAEALGTLMAQLLAALPMPGVGAGSPAVHSIKVRVEDLDAPRLARPPPSKKVVYTIGDHDA